MKTNTAFLLRHKKAKSQGALILIFSEQRLCACEDSKTLRAKIHIQSQVNQEVRLWLKLLFATVAVWPVEPSFSSTEAREAASLILKPWWVKRFEGGLSNEGNAM